MRRHLSLIATTFALLLAGPAAAASACSLGPSEQVFARWLDPLAYGLAPGGGLEPGTAGDWTLSGGARIVEGNESFYVGDAKDHRSLLLPAGSRATSPEICLSVDKLVTRFFVRRNAGGLLGLATLKVDAVLDGGLAVPVGLVLGGRSWQPTLPLPMLLSLTGATVQLRFTPLGGEWQIDDVYVDPWSKR